MVLSKISYKDIRQFTGDEARELQRLLNNCGYRLDADGIVGPNTINAFNSFKSQNFLSEPYMFGSTTYVYLKRFDHNLAPAIKIIKEFEGLVLSAYLCPAGVMTIGYGTTVYPDGKKVQRGDRITAQRAEELLAWYVNDRIVPKLSSRIPYWGEMSNNQRCALISFAYNVGEHFYGSRGYATITRTLGNKDWNAVPNAMMLYVNPGTSAEKGLRRRRDQECALWRRT